MEVRPIDAGRLKYLRRNIGKLYAIDDDIDDQVVDYRIIVNAPTLRCEECPNYDSAFDCRSSCPNCERTLSLNTLRDEIYEDAVAHGLWEDYDIGLSEELLDDCHELIYDEVDELDNAIEDFYNGHGIERFSEELADVVIMCMSVAGKLGIDIDAAIRRKMEINRGRPWKHRK